VSIFFKTKNLFIRFDGAVVNIMDKWRMQITRFLYFHVILFLKTLAGPMLWAGGLSEQF